MNKDNEELGRMLESAEMAEDARPADVQSAHDRFMKTVSSGRRRVALPRSTAAAVIVLGLTAAGLAGTQAGRDWIRSLFTPIQPTHAVFGEHGDDTTWVVQRLGPDAGPFSDQEVEDVNAEMKEIAALKQAGDGRLVGLMEIPAIYGQPGAEELGVAYEIEYTLKSGKKNVVGDNCPSPAQRTRMRLAEIMRQRDAGKGEVISATDFPMGLGKYVIRYTLDDGRTVDLEDFYPPAPHADREAIFEEVSRLREARQFVVLSANREAEGPVSGVLQYTLSDGRVVGVVETIPADVISEDGENVVNPMVVNPMVVEPTDAEDPSEQ